MATYYYTSEEKQSINLLVSSLKLNFDFNNCEVYPVNKYGAQSFVTYSNKYINIRRISKGNYYPIGSKEFFCKEVCYLIDEKFYVVRNGSVIQVKQKNVLTNEPTH